MSREVDGAGNRWVASTSKPLAVVAAITFVLAAASQQAGAQRSERSGKDVVEAVCAACHGTGTNGAPKIGDKHAWNKLASRGLSSLTQSALKGIRKMPAHGGNPAVSDLEIGLSLIHI